MKTLRPEIEEIFAAKSVKIRHDHRWFYMDFPKGRITLKLTEKEFHNLVEDLEWLLGDIGE